MFNMALPGHSSYFASIVKVSMQRAESPLFFAAEQRPLWRMTAPLIWSLAHGRPMEDPALSVMRTLWDQPRWLEAYHLYDDRGAELFEQICELPEYYLTRTEDALLEQDAAQIIAAAPVECIAELGAGSAKKTTHLLRGQVHRRGRGIFAPIDVSLPGLEISREYVRRWFPEIEFRGLHARYEEGLCSIDRNLPTLFVFLGSTIGNFNPPALVRFFELLSQAMGPGDYLLLGADRVKSVKLLEAAYADSAGVTAEFILNVFRSINRLTGSNFDPEKMRYQSWYNPEWAQIEMYSVATQEQEIRFNRFERGFHWPEGDRILVEISRKFDPIRLQQQLGFFDLLPVEHFTDSNDWFSLLLFKKQA
jgi:dimethylhistidine N-methyltransferase